MEVYQFKPKPLFVASVKLEEVGANNSIAGRHRPGSRHVEVNDVVNPFPALDDVVPANVKGRANFVLPIVPRQMGTRGGMDLIDLRGSPDWPAPK